MSLKISKTKKLPDKIVSIFNFSPSSLLRKMQIFFFKNARFSSPKLYRFPLPWFPSIFIHYRNNTHVAAAIFSITTNFPFYFQYTRIIPESIFEIFIEVSRPILYIPFITYLFNSKSSYIIETIVNSRTALIVEFPRYHVLHISRFVQSWPSFNLCTRYIITSALIIDCTIHCASPVPHLAQVVLPAHNFFPFPPHRVQPPLPRAKGERARRGKPRIPRLRYLLMPLWLKKKAWNFLVTSGRERGRGRGSCDVATPEDFLIKNGRERLRKHSTSTAIVSDDLSARRAKRKGGGGKRGRRRRKNGGRKIQVENTGDVVFFGHHQPRLRGEITRQNRKNGDGTTEISLRQPTLSCICGREGREWEREGGRYSYYNACAWSPFVSLFPFFFFLFFLFFFFDPTTVNLGEAVHFLLFLRPEDEWS